MPCLDDWGTIRPVNTGLHTLLERGHPQLDGLRVGLITNQTGVDSRLRSNIDLLHASDRLDLRALFGPEHGVRGDAQAGASVSTTVDARTGLPMHSLYGQTHSPTPEMLAGLDALIFDLQDIGVRYATYASTMLAAQESAATEGLLFAVLDRPNPLGGEQVEGPPLDPEFTSFVGAYRMPVRHGLTLGELARLAASERGWPEPVVVPMEGWSRASWYDETGLLWVQPTPNLPTLDAVTLYPGTCLIEGTNVSEGRGTTRPFELLGAPWIDPYELAAWLESRQLPGVLPRPAWFTPTFSKHAGELCGGVQLHITDRDALRPTELGIRVLHAIRSIAPDSFAWHVGGHGRHFLDLLIGSDAPRRALEGGTDPDAVVADWRDQAAAFEERRRPYLLYS